MLSLSRFTAIALTILFLIPFQSEDAHARPARVGLIPNGDQNRCANCHINPGGGGPRDPFGLDVEPLVSGGQQEFWDAVLAAEDSDDDGFTNGEELGDPDGDGIPNRSVNITLPGDANDAPVAELGDCNLDTVLDGDDLSCVSTTDARDAVLEVLNALPGDLNGDGEVAFGDFLTLSANFGAETASYSEGNIDLTGAVDFTDFLTLSSNFGQTPAAAAAAVPEPGGTVPIMVAVTCLVLSRRKRSRSARTC